MASLIILWGLVNETVCTSSPFIIQIQSRYCLLRITSTTSSVVMTVGRTSVRGTEQNIKYLSHHLPCGVEGLTVLVRKIAIEIA